MSKKILALLLCIFMLLPVLVSCGGPEFEDIGPYITMYLTDEIYDFDPINAYYNTESYNIVSMLYDTLFVLDSKGKVKNSLAEEYVISENVENNEYTMEITLKNTCWSNGTQLQADDVCYAWKRLLNSNNSYEASSLLFDIKNARAVKNGDASIDDIGVEAVSPSVVKVTFEGKIDYNQFLLNLTSLATAPLLESYVSKTSDWAKKPSTMVTSGPFKLSKVKFDEVKEADKTVKVKDSHAVDSTGAEVSSNGNIVQKIRFFTLDRNTYYDRDLDHDSITSSVTPAKILVDCTKTDEEILQDYKDGKLFYIGDIPLSLREDEYVQKYADVTDALSTFVAYFNFEANVNAGGSDTEQIFAIKEVRQALSAVIDREAIAKAVVFAEAATALVPGGVFNYGTSKDFRKVGGSLITENNNLTKAQELLASKNITPSKYTFTIKVASNDDAQILMAEMIAESWKTLGFNVSVTKAYTIQNNDYYKETDSVAVDLCDDQLVEAFQHKDFEVICFDYVAYSADAYSMLSNFALSFSGMAWNVTIDAESGSRTYSSSTNRSGYNVEKYNNIMEAVYYIPYFATLDRETSQNFLGIYATAEDFQKTYDAVKGIYEEYGIKATTKSSEWAKQKATLLHKAEELLIEDCAIIPVVFEKNAVLSSKKLTKVSSTYYVPSIFRKASLRGYEDFYYAVEIEGTNKVKTHTIFENFPTVNWDKVSK